MSRQPVRFSLMDGRLNLRRVVRTARTRQDNYGKERASHAFYSHIHDEVTICDTFPATAQGPDEGEYTTENSIPEDNQEDEIEQSLSDSLQVRRQISRIHENMDHPSNRTLVRVLRHGGAKRSFILAVAKHSCGACEAQKRPAGPIVSRSPNSFPFNDIVGLDLFFFSAYEKHTLPAMNIVCWSTGLQRVFLLRDQSGETLRNACRNIWLRSYGRPRILVVDQQRSLCSGIFAEKVESDGTRLEMTPLEALWVNGKTERAGKDWKEDCYKTTQDGPEAQTWTDFEEDCDAVNQARASNINDSEYSAYQRVFGRNHPQMQDAILECGGADLGVVSRQQTGELAQERSMTMRRLALQTVKFRPQTRLHLGQALWFWRRGANAAKKPTNAFWHSGVVISNTLARVWIAYRGSVVKSARSQVRPFHDDDEAAHEHVTEHGERPLHEGDFSYEDITGQDEPPVDSPPEQGENTATGPPGPDGEGQMDVDPEARRRVRGKTRHISLEQPTVSPVNASPDATRQESETENLYHQFPQLLKTKSRH